jgi:hypothetical protein
MKREDNTKPNWLTKWGHMLESTPDGHQRIGPAPQNNLGAVEDGTAANDPAPLNDVRSGDGSMSTGVISLKTARYQK